MPESGDSYNTAIQFGNVDLQNLISAMRVTVIGQEYSVAIDESCLSMVEHFLFGRFKMYETVYFNAYKLFSEELLQLIFRRAKTLISDGKSEMLGMRENSPFYKLLTNGTLTVNEYMKLDDPAVESWFAHWMNMESPGDELLSTLVRAFLYRNRQKDGTLIFQRIRVFYESDDEVQDFLRQMDALIRKYVPQFPEIHPNSEQKARSYAFINIIKTCKIYMGAQSFTGRDGGDDRSSDKNVIWILQENGTVQDVGNLSHVLGDEFHKSYLCYSQCH